MKVNAIAQDLAVVVTVQSQRNVADDAIAVFSYQPPVVASVSPVEFASSGGGLMTIIGSNFGGEDSNVTVTFVPSSSSLTRLNCSRVVRLGFCGLSPCVSFLSLFGIQWNNDTMCTCVIPEGFGSDYAVQVATPKQSSVLTDAPQFSYLSPNVTAVVGTGTFRCGINGVPVDLT
jgi:hypothetical protein